jgi:dienelactone hydrolase
MQMRAAAVVLALMATASAAHAAEHRTAATQRGVTIQVLEDLPKGPGPFPVVVLASGQGGDMTQPLLERLASALPAEGIAVVRFDWAYRTANPATGQQSADLTVEEDDMGAALALARKDPRLDPARIVLMGKSMGSVVAVRLFDRSAELRGAVLLTPVCSLPKRPGAPDWYAAPYAAFARQTRAMAMVAGDKDPVCSPADLYRMATTAAGPVRVAVVGGDHGFKAGPDNDPAAVEATQRNLDLAVRNAVDATATYLQPIQRAR